MMRFVIAILAVAGAVVSALALQVHYSTATEPCSINEKWDCGVVNHSPFAVVGPVPVAAIGILGYLGLAVLALTRQRFLLHVAALAGLIFALISLLSLGWLAVEYFGLKRGAKRVV
jgi:uncharacterized membrane protein